MWCSQVLPGYSHSSAGENKVYCVECMINVALQAPMMRTQDQTVPNKISTFWDSENQMKRRLSVTNLSSENNLLMFRLNAPVVIRAKVKEVWTALLFIAMHYRGYTSLEVKGRWGLLLPPCLLIAAVQQPGTYSPPSRLKHSWKYKAIL